jgi:hypothetical protein
MKSMTPVCDTRRLVAAIQPLARSARLPAAGLHTLQTRKEHTMTMRSIAALLSVFAFEACAHEKILEPAAGAPFASGRQDVAETAVAGVTVEVAADSWKGDPHNLGSLFTAVRVTLQNDSGKALRVSYRDFKLSGASGSQYAAIAPDEARGAVDAAPQYPYRDSALESMSGPVGYPLIHDGYYEASSERLPTQDMLSQALPEGMVQDGGKVTGFIYFPSVTDREAAVEFDMMLLDASDGEAFGRVAIPFQTTQP